jgi:hypothetical protein
VSVENNEAAEGAGTEPASESLADLHRVTMKLCGDSYTLLEPYTASFAGHALASLVANQICARAPGNPLIAMQIASAIASEVTANIVTTIMAQWKAQQEVAKRLAAEMGGLQAETSDEAVPAGVSIN